MATQPTTDTGKPRLRSQGDELTVIAQRAQAFTNASGTAIALGESNAEEIICRARSGSAAPDVGAALRVEGTFTGLCIQSGKELRCDDAETDTRVDTAAIRALGIRSMVVAPIKEDNRVIGVLACFAPTAHAFTITHVAVLKTMADQIAVLLQKERRAREVGIAPEPASPAAPVTMPKPVASAPAVVAPVVIKPAPSSNGVNGGARVPFPVVSKAEPVVAREAELPVPLIRREEKQRPEVRASFGTLDAVAGENKPSGLNTKLVGAAALLAVVAAAATFYFVKMRKPNTAVPVQQAQEVPAVQPGTQTETAAPGAASSTNGNSTGNVAASANSGQPATAGHANSAGSAPFKPNPAEAGKRNETNTRAAERVTAAERNGNVIADDQPQKPVPATVAIVGGKSRIASSNAASSADVTPSFTVAASNTPGALSALARPVGTSAPSIAQSDFQPVRVLKTVPPVYPPIAKIRRLSGSVTVEFTVGKNGRASNMKLVDGPAVFRDAAFDSVKQWQFKPAVLNGQPIEQTTRVKVDFNL